MTEGKVTRYILCKLDGREYIPGDTYEGTPERIDELAKLGYLQKASASSDGSPASEDQELDDDENAGEPAGEEGLDETSTTPEKKTQRGKQGSANGAAAD